MKGPVEALAPVVEVTVDSKEARALERPLQAEVLERVRRIAALWLEAEAGFVPGQTPVRDAGRVHDAQASGAR